MYEVTFVNMKDGSVQGHKAGCTDLAKKHKREEKIDVDASSKADARAQYNTDFDEETDGWYDINWLPCTDHIPSTDEVAKETVETISGITVKQGSKWTYLYAADGSLIAELRNDQLDTIRTHYFF